MKFEIIEGVYFACFSFTSISVNSQVANPVQIAVSRSHPSLKMNSFISQFDNYDLHPMGSSLKICSVSDGTVDFYPRLGPDSFKKHLLQSIQTGLKPAVYISAGLSLDIDTWTDVEACEAVEPGLLRILLEETPRWLEKV